MSFHYTLNAVIIDDEKESCDNLVQILNEFISDKVNIAGVANDAREAELLIKKNNPDFIFLDIDMPGENAFQLLERLHPFAFEIIFVTAYDDFAIRAFKLNAVDYILKPICFDDLSDALQKMKQRLLYKKIVGSEEPQASLLRQVLQREQPQKIVLKSQNHVEMVDFRDIYCIEGQGSYCKIAFNKQGMVKEILTSSILSYYEELLPAEYFFRVHKSFLINCLQVDTVDIFENQSVSLKNKQNVPVSRRRFSSFIHFLKENKLYSV